MPESFTQAIKHSTGIGDTADNLLGVLVDHAVLEIGGAPRGLGRALHLRRDPSRPTEFPCSGPRYFPAFKAQRPSAQRHGDARSSRIVTAQSSVGLSRFDALEINGFVDAHRRELARVDRGGEARCAGRNAISSSVLGNGAVAPRRNPERAGRHVESHARSAGARMAATGPFSRYIFSSSGPVPPGYG